MISVALKLLGGKISLLINSAGSTGDTLGRDKADPNLPSHGRINCTEIRNLHVRNETYTSQKKAFRNLLQKERKPLHLWLRNLEATKYWHIQLQERNTFTCKTHPKQSKTMNNKVEVIMAIYITGNRLVLLTEFPKQDKRNGKSDRKMEWKLVANDKRHSTSFISHQWDYKNPKV